MYKRLSTRLTAVVAMLFAMFSNTFAAEDRYGHTLVSLWNEYYEYEGADRPRSAAEVLEKICAEAEKKHLPWDFYDGWVKYANCRKSINWKDANKVDADFDNAVKRFDEPIVTFLRNKRTNSRNDFVDKNSGRLASSHNKAFYDKGFLEHNMNGELHKYIKNDKEFVLWYIFVNNDGRLAEELKNEIGNVYPAAAYIDYLQAYWVIFKNKLQYSDRVRTGWKGEEMMRNVSVRWTGTAIAYMAQCQLLEWEKVKLDGKKSTSGEYQQLRIWALSLTKEKSRFAGNERAILAKVENAQRMVELLDKKSLGIYKENDNFVVEFCNISSCTLTISDENKKQVFNTTVKNPVCSYYVRDKETVQMPEMDDGSYKVVVKSGEARQEAGYEKHSVSISIHRDAKGYSLYAADSKTGKPVERVNVMLESNGNLLYSSVLSASAGVIRLPEAFASQYKKAREKYVSCSYTGADGFIKKSPKMYMFDNGRDINPSAAQEDELILYTDRGAYNAGDTVYFKAILCNGIDEKYKTLSDNEIEFNLYDVDNTVQGNLKALTNEFGSASGKFVIPEGLKNGWFEVRARTKSSIASANFPVGDFQIPSYEIKVDPQEEFHIAGDIVHVSGVVRSYSGHPLSGAKLAWNARGVYDAEDSGTLIVGSDGRFEFSFVTDEDRRWNTVYVVNMKFLSPTGEVLESRTSVPVYSRLYCNLELEDALDTRMETLSYHIDGMLNGDSARFKIHRENLAEYPVSWRLYMIGKDAKNIRKYCQGKAALDRGVVTEGNVLDLDMSGYVSGVYAVLYEGEESRMDGRNVESEGQYVFALLKSDSETLPAEFPTFMSTRTNSKNDDFSLLLGNAKGARWALVQLHDAKCRPVFSKVVKFANGKVEKVDFQYLPEWTDEMQLKCYYFFDNSCYQYGRHFKRNRNREYSIPVDFTRFLDTTSPLSEYEYSFKTDPGAECLVSVYDAAVDKINPVYWRTLERRNTGTVYLYMRYDCGGFSTSGFRMFSKSSSFAIPVLSDVVDDAFINLEDSDTNVEIRDYVEEVVEEEDAIPFSVAEKAPGFDPEDVDVMIRDEFARTLCFLPHLRPAEDGTVTFPMKTSGTLSTFNVNVLAHTSDMRMGLIQRQMRVTIPVKVEVLAPEYLYVGDKCSVPVNLANASNEPVSGTLTAYVYDTADYKTSQPVAEASVDVTVPAVDAVSVVPPVDIPAVCGKVGLKYVFKVSGEDGGSTSDAVFVSFPVYSEYQTITESHSCIVMPGEDRQHIADSLSSAFVNTMSYGGVQEEKSIVQLLSEAVPGSVETDASDVISLTSALYIYEMASKLSGVAVQKPEDLESRIELCHNADGGYSWFPGMESSPVITAVVLEKYGDLKSRGVDVPAMDDAVKYMDARFFDKDKFCPLSVSQYLYARSMWASVPLTEKVSGNKRQGISYYLEPRSSKNRGLNGYVLELARRLRTMLLLTQDEEGKELASALGLPARSLSRVAVRADAISLMEYAVNNGRGVWYYPNAVMPFRGLLEGEAYAHALICRLMDDVAAPDNDAAAIARGIRMWLMTQKETQDWKSGAGYLDAISAVLEDAENLDDVNLLTISKTYRKPFNEIKAEGNEMSVSRKFYREDSEGKLDEIHEGDAVKVGDVIYGVYEVWSKENRSYVRISAPRESALHPAEQISGYYRDVRKERTDYYMEVCPEEKSVITEKFHVQRAGTFTAPVTTVDCLYAPHYRATASYVAPLNVL